MRRQEEAALWCNIAVHCLCQQRPEFVLADGEQTSSNTPFSTPKHNVSRPVITTNGLSDVPHLTV